MTPELLDAMQKLGPLDKTEQTRLPTSPLMELNERGSFPIKNPDGMDAVPTIEEPKRALPKAREAVREEFLETEWRELVAPAGSGRLSEAQAVDLFECIRDDARKASSSPPSSSASSNASLALSVGIDEEVLKTLLKFCSAPHISTDSSTDEKFGSWIPKMERPE